MTRNVQLTQLFTMSADVHHRLTVGVRLADVQHAEVAQKVDQFVERVVRDPERALHRQRLQFGKEIRYLADGRRHEAAPADVQVTKMLQGTDALRPRVKPAIGVTEHRRSEGQSLDRRREIAYLKSESSVVDVALDDRHGDDTRASITQGGDEELGNCLLRVSRFVAVLPDCASQREVLQRLREERPHQFPQIRWLQDVWVEVDAAPQTRSPRQSVPPSANSGK